MLTHAKIAEVFLKEATKLSSMAMLGKLTVTEAIFEYRILLDTLEKQPDEVKFHFAWAVQERTEKAIEIYNRMGPKASEAMITLLPENITMTVLCYETVGAILGDRADAKISYLRREFNKLPYCDRQNPARTYAIYKSAVTIK